MSHFFLLTRFRSRPQAGFWGHQKDVEMGLQQDLSMQLNPIKLAIGRKDFKPLVPVRIIPEDTPFFIPPAGDVIPSSWIFYAKRSSHENRIQYRNHLVNSSGLTPIYRDIISCILKTYPERINSLRT